MEKKIKKFKINKKNKNSYQISMSILKLIGNFSKSKNSTIMIKELSNIFDMPQKVLNLKYKKLLYSLIDYKSGSFSNKPISNFIYFFREIIKCIFLIVMIIFSSKKKEYNKFDFILHGVDDRKSFERYKLLLNKFKKPLVISKKKLNFKTKNISIKYSNFFLTAAEDLVNGKKIKIINLFMKIIFISLIHNFNYLYFLNLITYSILKNYKLFEINRGKYLMEDRFYNTCPIRNFYFKKFGGILTSTPQKNILETSISFFIDIDIFFSLGKEKFSSNRIRNLGGNFKNIIPVGSFFLEHEWYKKKKDQRIIPKIDILFTGINPNNWLYINNINYHNNNLYRIWIKKISGLYPDLSIKIKNHGNFKGSQFEKNFFKKSNVEILENKSINASYGYMNKSKIIFSLGSTTILEAISMNKNGYFINPSAHSKNFFFGLKNLEKISIKSFLHLKRTIKEKIFLFKQNKIKKNEYCLKSDNVSKRVFNFFKNYK